MHVLMYICLQVWSTELPKSTLFAGKAIHHNIYDHSKSETFKPSAGEHWNITYGDGSTASGNVGTDVSLSGTPFQWISEAKCRCVESEMPSLYTDPKAGS